MGLEYTLWTRSSSAFVSVQSGNWNAISTWKIKGTDGNLYPCPFVPERGNDVYIEAAHTVTCTQNEACKDLNLNTTQDVVRINTGAFKLDIYGNRGDYSGTHSTAVFSSANAGIAGWIAGTLRFKGTSRIIASAAKPVSANARSSGYTLEVDIAVGQKLQIDTLTVRCGFLLITSGELEIIPYNATSYEIRISGNDYTAQPGDGVNGGTVTVKSNGKLTVGRIFKNSPTSAKNGLDNFTIDAGGVYTPTLAALVVPCIAYALNGTVSFTQSLAQEWIAKGSNVDSVAVSTYSTVKIGGGSFAKTLKTNTTINTLLSFSDALATVSLGGFTVSYGTSADIEYTVSRNIGNELPNSGAGTAICRNLLIGTGIVLNLQGRTINIRGSIVGGGSTTNGTLNINQP